MKRVYEKPMMESEAFIANEYVAGCWTVSCTSGCNTSFTYKGDQEPDRNTSGFGWSNSGNCVDYSGSELGRPNLVEIFTHGRDHLVSITPVGGAHPNASV